MLVLALGVRALARGGATRWSRGVATVVSDLRTGVFARRAWPVIVLASALAVAGHVITFLVAARDRRRRRPRSLELVPLALLVLVAMGIPANVAGWGPREGVAAWVFGAAGLGAARGSRPPWSTA